MSGVARPIIADMLVHGGESAQIAIRALRHVDDHVPFFHGVSFSRGHLAGTNVAAFRVGRGFGGSLASLDFSGAAKAAEIQLYRLSLNRSAFRDVQLAAHRHHISMKFGPLPCPDIPQDLRLGEHAVVELIEDLDIGHLIFHVLLLVPVDLSLGSALKARKE